MIEVVNFRWQTLRLPVELQIWAVKPHFQMDILINISI